MPAIGHLYFKIKYNRPHNRNSQNQSNLSKSCLAGAAPSYLMDLWIMVSSARCPNCPSYEYC